MSTNPAQDDDTAWMTAHYERIEKARAAVAAALGPWKKGAGHKGEIDCPNCGKPGALSFRRAGCNGHIAARCDTPGCCSWIE